MQQFYSFTVPADGTPIFLHFKHPVRKISISALSSFIALSVGKAKNGDKMLVVGALQYVTVDFQRANTGKSVQDLTFWKYAGEGASRVSVSVSEYGSYADNTFFE